MSFPSITHCILCDDVRPELSRKFTILGFFGILPEVNIVVKDITRPIEKLTFLLTTAEEPEIIEATYHVLPQIYDDSENEVTGLKDELEVHILEPKRKLVLILTVGMVKFPKAGKYKFRLVVNERPVFEEQFIVTENAAEFKNNS